MVPTATLLAFAAVAFGMVITPGPNMIYLVSRSVMQGRKAGFISLAGVAAGFLVYLVLASVGLTAILMAVPFAYDALRLAGAAYLLLLAWQVARSPGTVFTPRALPADSPKRLFAMGFVTNLLNPKIAVMYLSLLPQFVDPASGHVFLQSLTLGVTQISVSMITNSGIILAAGSVAGFMGRRPLWQAVQRWVMATVLAGLAVKLAVERR